GCSSVRVDTHASNKAMLGALEKAGYRNAGIFLLSYGPEAGCGRTAFEKVLLSSDSDKKKPL
ncbi:MAG: hypothetical protein ACI4S4_03935, partial [Candidatus Ornithospirochaeta sp.]